jgi:hypothetical protein
VRAPSMEYSLDGPNRYPEDLSDLILMIALQRQHDDVPAARLEPREVLRDPKIAQDEGVRVIVRHLVAKPVGCVITIVLASPSFALISPFPEFVRKDVQWRP